MINHYHIQGLFPPQCGATLVQTIHAPLPLVWSILRRFDRPQSYMLFVKSCTLRSGDGNTVGTVREMEAISGLPVARSTERLEKLDDDTHVMVYSIIDGDHRLVNYKSTTTLHEVVAVTAAAAAAEEKKKTVVTESYVVDVPEGNGEEETCTFVSTILGSNLKSLAKICEKIAANSDLDQLSAHLLKT